MHYAEHPPAPALRDLVRCYWFLRADAAAASAEAEPALPDGSPELILSLADPFFASPRNAAEHLQPDLFVVGQITKPFRVRPSGRVDLVAVRLEAHAATWLSLDLAATLDREVDVADLCEGKLAQLRQTLMETSRGAGGAAVEARRVAILDEVLVGLMHREPQPDWRVREAVLAIRSKRGLVDLAELADALKTTPRSLQRLFKRDVGLTPKFLVRVVRFQAVFAAWREDPQSLSRVAQDCGYFDHAHLVRDFRELAGVPPAALLPSMPEFTRMLTQA